jgi:hypothetical protein
LGIEYQAAKDVRDNIATDVVAAKAGAFTCNPLLYILFLNI